MPAYEEALPKRWFAIIFLTIAFLLIYSPFQLNNWQLRRREDRFAAIAYEMELKRPNTVVHGEQIPFYYPLFPWLTALIHRTGLSFEYSLRLISVISVAFLTILVWEAGRRALDVQTAVVAAAMMFSTSILVEKGIDGYPNMTALLFVFSAWVSWFTFGVARGQWNKAWIVSFLFCGLAFYTLGWTAVIYFSFPLIFMRRPMTVWPKLKKPGFIFGLALFLCFVLVWTIPRWHMGTDIPFRSIQLFPGDFEDYWKKVLQFPFDVLFRFMPWSLIAWPAFCVAYFPLDKNPIFSRFLRTIFISLFFLLWLGPFMDSRDLIFLAPPLSIMCGINYWLFVRRHGHQIHKFLKVLSFCSMALGLLIILFYATPFPWSFKIQILPENLEFRNSYKLCGILQALIATVISLMAIILVRRRLQVYLHILMICMAIGLCFWAVNIPYKSQDQDKKVFGQALALALKKDLGLKEDEPIPENTVVYKGPGILGLYVPCLYMGAKVKKIHSLDQLPENQDLVYMITTQYPVSNKRSWDYVTPKDIISEAENPYIYSETRFYILKGKKLKKEKDLRPSPLPEPVKY